MKEQLDLVIEKLKELTKKECYRFEIVDGKPRTTDTKLGGNPYLPKGYEYPTDEFNNPLALLFQINFEDIELEDYPDKGILEIFVDTKLSYPSKYKILYFETIEECETDFPTLDLNYFMINEEYKLKLEKCITYMPINDYRFDDLLSKCAKECGLTINYLHTIEDDLNDDEAFDYIINKLPATYAEIGGYANFTQYDPREGNDSELTECILKLDSYLDNNGISNLEIYTTGNVNEFNKLCTKIIGIEGNYIDL